LPSDPQPSSQLQGLIFHIRSHAVHDGPGVRTTVFLKGCPLHCLWCCDPESQGRVPDLVWLKERCLGCDLCLPACPRSALARGEHGERQLDQGRCDHCGACAEACPGEALDLMGRWLTVEQVLAVAMRDALHAGGSGGGLTLSGGEPLAQVDFAAELLDRYKHQGRGMHTAVATCGQAPWWHVERLAPNVDLFLYDLKHMDPDEHRRYTGAGNEDILDNARRLAEAGRTLVIRVPLIPGVNDTRDNLEATAAFVRTLPGVERLDLLPYHRVAEPKHQRLGRVHALAGSPAFGPEKIAWAKDLLERAGMKVQVAGEFPELGL
jgi:pyruvate formate lyase activating enzyme